MMDYETFKKVIKTNFKAFLPSTYQNAWAEIKPVNKVNHTVDELVIRTNEPGMDISPAINVTSLYEEYAASENLNNVLEKAAKSFMIAVDEKKNIDINNLTDAETVKDKIVFQLINTGQNREMLDNMPHREFKDLSVIYRIAVQINDGNLVSAYVSNNLTKKLGFTEEQLFQLAFENTKRLFPPVIRPMEEVLRELFIEEGMSADMVNMIINNVPSKQPIYVISTSNKINGAVSMLYEDKLHELAEKVNSDLYILPSSIHEIIAICTNNEDPNELAAMVTEINNTEVTINEQLSNSVYHYDKNSRELTVATYL